MISNRARELLKKLKRDLAFDPDFITFKSHTEFGLFRHDFAGNLTPGVAVTPQLDRLIHSGRRIKHDATSTVSRIERGNASFIIKRFNKRGVIQSTKTLVSKTRAEKAFIKSLLLRALNVPTPEPLLFCVSKSYGVPTVNYLVTVCSKGETLCDLFDSNRISAESWTSAVSMVKELIESLHSNRITHGDIKTPNLLYDGRQVEILDLDGLRVHLFRLLFNRSCQKDLNAFMSRVKNYPQRNGLK